MAIGAVAAQFVFISAAAVFAAQGQREVPDFKTEQGRAHYQRGLEYGDRGLWAPAILELNRANSLEPGNAGILMELGIVHGERKEWKQAIASLRKAAAIAPSSAQAHYNLALTLDRADPGKGAGTAEYWKALRLDPRYVQALINLIDFGMDVQQAGEAPRFRHAGEEVLLESAFSASVRTGLEKLGHHVAPAIDAWGGYQGILIDPGTGALSGGSDPRKDGLAIGW